MTMMEFQQPLPSSPCTFPASQFVFYPRNIFIKPPLQIPPHSVLKVTPALYVGIFIRKPSTTINIITCQFFVHKIIPHLLNNKLFTVPSRRPTIHWPKLSNNFSMSTTAFAIFLWISFNALHPHQNIFPQKQNHVIFLCVLLVFLGSSIALLFYVRNHVK